MDEKAQAGRNDAAALSDIENAYAAQGYRLPEGVTWEMVRQARAERKHPDFITAKFMQELLEARTAALAEACEAVQAADWAVQALDNRLFAAKCARNDAAYKAAMDKYGPAREVHTAALKRLWALDMVSAWW